VAERWASAIRCPVFIGLGQRDVSAEPHREPSAYRASTDISLCLVPGMAHIHNLAGTRRLLWQRLQSWMETVAASTRTDNEIAP
jgi:hypothetical protein